MTIILEIKLIEDNNLIGVRLINDIQAFEEAFKYNGHDVMQNFIELVIIEVLWIGYENYCE